MPLSLRVSDEAPLLREALADLSIPVSEQGEPLYLELDDECDGLSVRRDGTGVHIRYSEMAYLFRALSLLMERADEPSFTLTQHPRFSMNGAMLDCSRNAVRRVESVKAFIRQLALMGHNTLLLYTEDTYEIENNPYFGYMRGRYSPEELRELDDYAARFGVELIPCIQTLAHLQSALRWWAYGSIHDIDDILLCEDERSYALIEEMIKACRAAFRSGRIHIGMDEAEHLGRGRYLDRHGPVERFDILSRHLQKVREICRRYAFEPMMWSDMFFRYTGGERAAQPEDRIKQVPEGVGLVYWDYYSTNREMYDRNLKSHKQLSNPIIFAGGGWCWTSYGSSVKHSLRAMRLALEACADNTVQQVFCTLWGDDGADASMYAALPVVQLFAELSFDPEQSEETFARRFHTCTGGSLDDFLLLGEPDQPGGQDCAGANPCKYLLFQDPLCGLFDKHVAPGYNDYYAQLSEKLAEAAARNPQYTAQFEAVSALCAVLSLKAEVGVQLKAAYDADDRDALRVFATKTLPEMADRAAAFKDRLCRLWMQQNKPFGFEVQDIRISGVIGRARSAAARVLAYVDGDIDRLEELEQERLYFDCRTAEGRPLDINYNIWRHQATACVM